MRTLVTCTLSSLAAVVVFVGVAGAACPKGDLTGDCKIDYMDIKALAEQWLEPPGKSADIDGLNGVEWRDIALLAQVWGEEGIPMVINEFMASNSGGDVDPQGQDDDWIEIFNAGDEPIDMGGMHLTNDLDDPEKWRIPDDNPGLTTIEPKGHLIIWADIDEEDYPAGIHANFEINASGGELGLFDSNSAVLIDKVKFPDQTPNISYGRSPDGSDAWQFLAFPTHNTANTGAYLGQVADTKFSHNRGFYDAPFSVTIATDTNDAEIYYTLDGSSPLDFDGQFPTGTLYASPIPISTTTCLRAVAFKPGYKPTNVDAQSYIFLDDVIQQDNAGLPNTWGDNGADYAMDPDVVDSPSYRNTIKNDLKAVPTMALNMPLNDWFGSNNNVNIGGIYSHPQWEDDYGPEAERRVSVEYIDPMSSEQFQINAMVRIAGGSSTNPWKMDKLSMRLKFTGRAGPAKLEFPVFGDEAADQFDTLVLDARMNNSWAYGGGVSVRGSRPWGYVTQRDIAQYTRERFVSDLQIAMGSPGPGPYSKHVHLYLNGIYWGLYLLHERPDEHFAEEYFGGEAEDYDVLKHNSSTILNGTNSNYIAMFNISNLASNSKYQLMQQYVDLPNLIDYMIANYYVCNTDWSHHNWYATKNAVDPAGRWRYHSWDAEHCIEGLSGSEADRTTRNDSRAPTGLQYKLAANTDYKMLFADRVHRHFANGGVLSPEGAAKMYQICLDEVDRAVVGESARWGDNQRSTPFTRNVEWVRERDWILGTYIPQRTDIVLGQFQSRGWYPNIDPPVFRVNGAYQHGGYIASTDSLSMTAGSGTVYYTLNGEDPRLPGGAVNTAHAIAYSSPITLSHSAQVKARLKNGSTWSALNEATYAIGPVAESLRITEIMYHPQETGDPNDPNEEFIELTNIGTQTINLNLVKFTNGVDFTFTDIDLAPREYVVVVRNEIAFAAAHPEFSGVVAGEYVGKLDNGGERIELQDAAGSTFFDFRYKDGWRSITDGLGYSLTIIDPNDTDEANQLPQGLVGHWKFDEGEGPILMDSAGSNPGIIYGTPNWELGKSGHALLFDGDGDYVSLVAPIEPLIGGSVTVDAWVRMVGRSVTVFNPVLMQHDAAGNGYYLYIFENMPVFAVMDGGAFVEAKSPTQVEAGRWYHIAGTNDGSNLRMYVDGALKATTAAPGLQGTSYEARIGCDFSSPAYYHGLIDDVRVYDRPLNENDFEGSNDILERWCDKDSWRASAYIGGSPGWDDSGIVPNPGAVVINEIMAHSHAEAPDWIELHNTADEDI
ncbi:MAG: lamin tail domain-containing protein, partial [Planctomycetota bacterium]